MNDFEVHPRGTAEEIRLSRALARSVVDAEKHMSLPIPILEAIADLQKIYNRQIESGADL